MFSCVVCVIGFEWNLHFKWDGLSERRKAMRITQTTPVQ